MVPVFNQENFIRKCLAGIGDNITAPSDLVVIVDCCTDRSEAAVLSFVEEARGRFRRVTVLRTTYPIFETRADNLGFLLSRGDHVIEVQSDIEVLTGGFDALLKAPMQEALEIFSDIWPRRNLVRAIASPRRAEEALPDPARGFGNRWAGIGLAIPAPRSSRPRATFRRPASMPERRQ